MGSNAQFFENIGQLLEQVMPKLRGDAGADSWFMECGPMQWKGGDVKGRVYGPYRSREEAENYISVKIDRHRLKNANYHGEKGNPPEDDATYMGHPMFQYRFMTGREFFTRYYSQIIHVALQGINDLNTDAEPDIVWPNMDGVPDPILDDDEFPVEEEDNNVS